MHSSADPTQPLPPVPNSWISLGDALLVLLGKKTLHFLPIDSSAKPGDLLWLHAGCGDIPVIVDCIAECRGDHVLGDRELDKAGRHVPKKYQAYAGIRPADVLGHGHTYNSPTYYAEKSYRIIHFHLCREQDYCPTFARTKRVSPTEAKRAILTQWHQSYTGAVAGLTRRVERLPSGDSEIRWAHKWISRKKSIPWPENQPVDLSILDALEFLKAHRSDSINAIETQLRTQAFALRSHAQSPRIAPTLPQGIHNEQASGVGMARFMIAYPQVVTTLGIGALAYMGIIKRIATLNPVASSLHKPHQNPRRLISLQGKRRLGDYGYISAGNTEHFEVPMIIDTAQHLETREACAIDDVWAQEHGYLNAHHMRNTLGIERGENPTVYSYAIERARPEELPEDPDRMGSYEVRRINAVYDAWNANGSSVRDARKFLENYSTPEARQKALLTITPPRARKDRPPNGKGTGPLPSDVIAAKTLRGATAATSTTPAPSAKRAHAERKRLQAGDGWALGVAKSSGQLAERVRIRTRNEHPSPHGQQILAAIEIER